MTLKSGSIYNYFRKKNYVCIHFAGRCDEGLQTLTGEPCEVSSIRRCCIFFNLLQLGFVSAFI